MILTNQEIHEIGFDCDCKPFVNEMPHTARAFAHAIESAVIARLAARESVEPVGYLDGQGDAYTLDQLNTAIAAARMQMNERCAKLVESLMDEQEPWMNGDDIRALIGATP